MKDYIYKDLNNCIDLHLIYDDDRCANVLKVIPELEVKSDKIAFPFVSKRTAFE